MVTDVNQRSLCAKVCALALLASCTARAEIPDSLDDKVFWNLVEALSEPEGRFPPQYMSNEDSLQYVLPELVQRADSGGVYIGVGSEQNFTYLAALRPDLAFIVDIRRDNLRQVLLYKALFELAPDRASFVSKLFSRPLPARVDPAVDAEKLFAASAGEPADAALFEATRAEVLDNLSGIHGFALNAEDSSGIVRILDVFRESSAETMKGLGDVTNPSFALLMAATDLDGKAWGFLASEANYRAVREMHQDNLIVPLVGDFAGDTTLAGIAEFLREQEALVRVFYLSNVERYLWEQGEQGLRFYDNVALLPRDDSSLFVRSITSDISLRLAIPMPDQPAKWRTYVMPIEPDLDGVASGRIAGYRDLFVQ
jgi:hypothetical protein